MVSATFIYEVRFKKNAAKKGGGDTKPLSCYTIFESIPNAILKNEPK